LGNNFELSRILFDNSCHASMAYGQYGTVGERIASRYLGQGFKTLKLRIASRILGGGVGIPHDTP
jgi:hypothetical protein